MRLMVWLRMLSGVPPLSPAALHRKRLLRIERRVANVARRIQILEARAAVTERK